MRIGVDIGGTNLVAGLVDDNFISVFVYHFGLCRVYVMEFYFVSHTFAEEIELGL